MRGWRDKQGAGGGDHDHDHVRGSGSTPGKRTLTQDLPAGNASAATGQAAPEGVRHKVEAATGADLTIAAIDPAHPPPNRTLGRGGTVSMTEWGTAGSQDVPHEFGHMLGNFDEYNTVNGGGGTRARRTAPTATS